MQITWYGQSFFEFTIKGVEKEIVNLVIDPFSEDIGLKLPKLEADILLITHDHRDHNNVKAVLGSPFLIDEPGEYETKNVSIKGISSFHDDCGGKERGSNIIYKFEAEELKICHLGNLGQNELTSEQLGEIGNVDILIISVAGPFTNAKHVANIISQIEPRVVIPMHYFIPGLKLDIPDGVESFLKIMGAENIEPQKKLKITIKDLPVKETKIIILEP